MFKNFFVEIRGEFPAGKAIYNRLAKQAAHETAMYWFITFLKRHFTRDAYRLYEAYKKFFKQKRSPYKPLKDKGHLENTVLQQQPRVTGPYWRTKMRLKYGRPGRKTEKDIERSAWAMHRILKIELSEAFRRVYQAAGYDPRTKKLIEAGITSINEDEKKMLEAHAAKIMRKLYKEEIARRRQRRRKIKADSSLSTAEV